MDAPKRGPALLTMLIAAVIIIAIYTFLIMVIWNEVLIKKFPTLNIQKLSFLDAFALSVFFGILTSGTSSMMR